MKKNNIKKIIFYTLIFLFLTGCNSRTVKDKTFQNGPIIIIFFNDGKVSYNMITFKDYSFDKINKKVTVSQKNLLGEIVHEYFTYDPKNNCIYDENGTKYTYSGKSSKIKLYSKEIQ